MSGEGSLRPGEAHGTQTSRSEPQTTRLSGRDDNFENAGGDGRRIVTYREYVKNGLSPRMLGQAIVEQSQKEKIEEIYLSPDAFAQRTSEASIAEQLGDVLQQNGLPRPTPADDDRIGGWQLMYQLLERDAWVVTDNCTKLIECLPHLVRDERRVEDIRKVEGDDPADAARYGLVSGVRHAGVGAHGCAPGAGQAPPPNLGARFVPGVPLEVQIDRQISAVDATSRAIHQQRLQALAKTQLGLRSFGNERVGEGMFVFLKKVFTTKYVGMLEAELARLRAENRALMNSLLGTAGFPPVEFVEPVRAVELPRVRRRLWQQVQMKNEREAAKG